MQASQAALHAHLVLPIRMHLQWHRYLVMLVLIIRALLREARRKQAVSVTEDIAGQMLARVPSVLQGFTKTQSALLLAHHALQIQCQTLQVFL